MSEFLMLMNSFRLWILSLLKGKTKHTAWAYGSVEKGLMLDGSGGLQKKTVTESFSLQEISQSYDTLKLDSYFFVLGIGCHVGWFGRSFFEYIEWQNSRLVEIQIIPFFETSWKLCERSIEKVEIFARLVWRWHAQCFLDFWVFLYASILDGYNYVWLHI